MTWDNILAFFLGFVTATVLTVGIGFFWLKRRWKTLLFGLGSKLFSKGVSHVTNKAQRKVDDAQRKVDDRFREVGRQ